MSSYLGEPFLHCSLSDKNPWTSYGWHMMVDIAAQTKLLLLPWLIYGAKMNPSLWCLLEDRSLKIPCDHPLLFCMGVCLFPSPPTPVALSEQIYGGSRFCTPIYTFRIIERSFIPTVERIPFLAQEFNIKRSSKV